MTEVLRYAAFTRDPSGGNPAGIVLDAVGLAPDAMQAIAANVGYSETAFLSPRGPRSFDTGYFSPLVEVPFCGHATIAAAVALAERHGPGTLRLVTAAGDVAVDVQRADDALLATLTSVPPTVDPVSPTDLDEALAALGWRREDLDRSLPPRIAAAGARHLVLAAGTRARLRELAYDVDRLTRLMRRAGWTTVHLVWRESALVHHARDPFPVGGVIEDPATGAAAAAYGAYLRDVDELPGAARFTIHQGDDLGRPSQLFVELVADDDRVRVSGYAVALDG